VGTAGRSPLPWRSGDSELLPLGESSPDGGDKLRSTSGAAEKRPSTFSGNLGFSRKPKGEALFRGAGAGSPPNPESRYQPHPQTTLGPQASEQQPAQVTNGTFATMRAQPLGKTGSGKYPLNRNLKPGSWLAVTLAGRDLSDFLTFPGPFLPHCALL